MLLSHECPTRESRAGGTCNGESRTLKLNVDEALVANTRQVMGLASYAIAWRRYATTGSPISPPPRVLFTRISEP